MRALLFNPFNGIAGNMMVGALLDAGLPYDMLEDRLLTLPITGFSLIHERVERAGLMGTYFNVEITEAQPLRHLRDFIKVLDHSNLSDTMYDFTKHMIHSLAEAEGKAHNLPPDKIHFHEIGAVDTMIDLIGTAMGFDFFNITKFYTTPINVGTGFVKIDHGMYPVPTPATTELLKGYPIYSSNISLELTTPTGAAIISACVPTELANYQPILSPLSIGYGAGSHILETTPNFLRIIIGTTQEKDSIWSM